jgi:hypothetical protein
MTRQNLRWLAAAAGCLVLPVGFTSAVIWTVGSDPGDDFASIQSAITAASAGDEVHVSCGLYVENITMKDDVDVKGAGADCTTIDGGGSASVVSFNPTTTTTELSGFTIRNGLHYIGAGILIIGGETCDPVPLPGSGPVIDRTVIVGNQALRTPASDGGYYLGYGGGVGVYAAAPTISNSLVTGNLSEFTGGGIDMFVSCPTIVNSTIVGNLAVNPVGDGFGGGVYVRDSEPTISTNIIFGNVSEAGGGGIDLIGSLLAYVLYTDLNQNLPQDSSGAFTIGPGNLSVDPQFIDPSGPKPCLRSGSPAIDAGPIVSTAGPEDGLGRSREIDGDFDGVPRVDLGYCEGGDITRVTVDSSGLVSWDASVSGSATFNLYRGLLSRFRATCKAGSCEYTQDRQVILQSRQYCDLATTSFIDVGNPLLGNGYTFVVTGEDVVEGIVGFTSDGSIRANAFPCP